MTDKKAMEIGKPRKEIWVVPEDEPEEIPEPVEVPAEPVKVPEKEPEKVPAHTGGFEDFVAMEIGEPRKEIWVVPEDEPEEIPEPIEVPAEPVKVPQKEPEKVPAHTGAVEHEGTEDKPVRRDIFSYRYMYAVKPSKHWQFTSPVYEALWPRGVTTATADRCGGGNFACSHHHNDSEPFGPGELQGHITEHHADQVTGAPPSEDEQNELHEFLHTNHPEHTPPVENCRCGLYSRLDEATLQSHDAGGRPEFIARVKSRGKALLHDTGLRSQQLQIVGIRSPHCAHCDKPATNFELSGDAGSFEQEPNESPDEALTRLEMARQAPLAQLRDVKQGTPVCDEHSSMQGSLVEPAPKARCDSWRCNRPAVGRIPQDYEPSNGEVVPGDHVCAAHIPTGQRPTIPMSSIARSLGRFYSVPVIKPGEEWPE